MSFSFICLLSAVQSIALSVMLFCGFIRNGEFRVGMILFSNFIFRFYHNFVDSTLPAFSFGGCSILEFGWLDSSAYACI
jgi:Ni,Fe-hydrogenase I cytochrome b subunit